MRIVTANRLSDGRVVYLGAEGRAASSLAEATVFVGETAAETALAVAVANPQVFVGPYLVEVDAHAFIGRDRLKESIRAGGPTVGNSLAGGVG